MKFVSKNFLLLLPAIEPLTDTKNITCAEEVAKVKWKDLNDYLVKKLKNT